MARSNASVLRIVRPNNLLNLSAGCWLALELQGQHRVRPDGREMRPSEVETQRILRADYESVELCFVPDYSVSALRAQLGRDPLWRIQN